MQELLVYSAVATGFALFFLWIANYFHFFSRKRGPWIQSPTWVQAFLGFAVYLISLKAFSYIASCYTGSLHEGREVFWVNALTLWYVALVLIAFSEVFGKNFQKAVWGEEITIFSSLRAVGKGALTWLIAYPWVVAIDQFYSFVTFYTTGKEPDVIDQEMIRYLKELIDYKVLFVVTSLAVIVAVPIAEEVLFRGLLQGAMRPYLGATGAIIGASIIFALMHYSPSQGDSNFELIPALFVLSCFLGALYESEKQLLAPIALHSLFNGVTTLYITLGN